MFLTKDQKQQTQHIRDGRDNSKGTTKSQKNVVLAQVCQLIPLEVY